MCVLSPFSCVRLFATPWTVARQAPLSVGFSRQQYWSGLQYALLQGIFPTQGLDPSWQAGYLPLVPPGKPKILFVVVVQSLSCI